MITGATRGTGLGGALARHLLKEGNEVVVIPARGLGSVDLPGQVLELVAQSAGGRTDRSLYHVFCSPDPAIADVAAARARFWALFEAEFGMGAQPYGGVEHRKDNRLHEHRFYSLVRPSGAVVDLSWDYLRREKCSRVVEFEFGMPAVPSRHARSIERRLRREGRVDVADWLVASGTTTAERPVARLTPQERFIGERTGVELDDVRCAALAAWHAGQDGPTFLAALRVRGLDLRQGRVGPVIVDAAGTAHSATRVLGAAGRNLDGARITAAVVKTRLHGLHLEDMISGRDSTHATPGRAGPIIARRPGSTDPSGRGGIGLRRPDQHLGRPYGGGLGGQGGGASPAWGRLLSTSGARRELIRMRLGRLHMQDGKYLASMERARLAIERMDDAARSRSMRAYALWGITDMWGLPLT